MEPKSPADKQSSGGGITIYVVLGVIIGLVVSGGAAKLSYDKSGSFAWALVAFLFAPIYYVYYAYFISTRQVSLMGGRRR